MGVSRCDRRDVMGARGGSPPLMLRHPRGGAARLRRSFRRRSARIRGKQAPSRGWCDVVGWLPRAPDNSVIWRSSTYGSPHRPGSDGKAPVPVARPEDPPRGARTSARDELELASVKPSSRSRRNRNAGQVSALSGRGGSPTLFELMLLPSTEPRPPLRTGSGATRGVVDRASSHRLPRHARGGVCRAPWARSGVASPRPRSLQQRAGCCASGRTRPDGPRSATFVAMYFAFAAESRPAPTLASQARFLHRFLAVRPDGGPSETTGRALSLAPRGPRAAQPGVRARPHFDRSLGAGSTQVFGRGRIAIVFSRRRPPHTS